MLDDKDAFVLPSTVWLAYFQPDYVWGAFSGEYAPGWEAFGSDGSLLVNYGVAVSA